MMKLLLKFSPKLVLLFILLPFSIFAQDTTKVIKENSKGNSKENSKEIPKQIIKDTIPDAPKIVFLTPKEHFFGEKKKGEVLDFTFEIKNVGKKPLQIYRIQTSCHCSTTEWTKTPIESGKTAKITIHYDTKEEDKQGDVRKTFLLMSNASNKEEIFYFKGTILK